MNEIKPKTRKRRAMNLVKSRQSLLLETDKEAPQNKEWERWIIQAGISHEASRPASDIGIYTDFT